MNKPQGLAALGVISGMLPVWGGAGAIESVDRPTKTSDTATIAGNGSGREVFVGAETTGLLIIQYGRYADPVP